MNGIISYPFLGCFMPLDGRMKTNDNHNGNGSAIIISLPDGHGLKGPCYSQQELENVIKYSKRLFGNKFKVLHTYNNVSHSDLEKLKGVVRDLDAGKSVNLESALR